MLGSIQSALVVVATTTLRPAIFGPRSRRGALAIGAAVIAAVAGVVGDVGVAVEVSFEVLVIAILVGQVGNGALYLLAGTSLAGTSTFRFLGWLGLCGSIGYFVAAAFLAYQVLTNDFLGDAVRPLYFLLLFAIAFLALVGWFAITGAQLNRARTA